jgi:hypothetical protein
MHFGRAVEDGVELGLGRGSLLGGFAGMMPLANSPQVGQPVVRSAFYVIHVARFVAAPRAVLFQDLAPSTTPRQDFPA